MNVPAEVEHIWFSRSTVLKWLYLFQRHLPFIDLFMMTLWHTGGNVQLRRVADCMLTHSWIAEFNTVTSLAECKTDNNIRWVAYGEIDMYASHIDLT
jgi:hypothetical protein